MEENLRRDLTSLSLSGTSSRNTGMSSVSGSSNRHTAISSFDERPDLAPYRAELSKLRTRLIRAKQSAASSKRGFLDAIDPLTGHVGVLTAGIALQQVWKSYSRVADLLAERRDYEVALAPNTTAFESAGKTYESDVDRLGWNLQGFVTIFMNRWSVEALDRFLPQLTQSSGGGASGRSSTA